MRLTGRAIGALCVAAILIVSAALLTAMRAAAAPTVSPLLAECDIRPNVSLTQTEPVQSGISRRQAEEAARVIGVTGPAAVALTARVSVGTVSSQAPTSDHMLLDAHGVPIADRPAWVLIFRGQTVPISAGRSAAGPLQVISGAAAIVDASSGEFLRGWACTYASK